YDDLILFNYDGQQISEIDMLEISSSWQGLLTELEALTLTLTKDISIEQGLNTLLEGESLSGWEQNAL
ncbi:MAG: hypothetical protein GWM89_05650, partial [Candidatus Dadabacteria bacterium]|nr:hypothetical protein [Candidatus Dadabacteria bacterium]NIY21899.1 hypothetical protein [Candidatus Dadabacteria bacterium]